MRVTEGCLCVGECFSAFCICTVCVCVCASKRVLETHNNILILPVFHGDINRGYSGYSPNGSERCPKASEHHENTHY